MELAIAFFAWVVFALLWEYGPAIKRKLSRSTWSRPVEDNPPHEAPRKVG